MSEGEEVKLDFDFVLSYLGVALLPVFPYASMIKSLVKNKINKGALTFAAVTALFGVESVDAFFPDFRTDRLGVLFVFLLLP